MKKMNKTTKNNFITYAMVIAAFVVVQTLSSTGNLSRLLTGLLVPICVYTIAAVSLNLVVGFSGELSLGHAGFMCVGAYSSALFSHVAKEAIPPVPRFILAILIHAGFMCVGAYSSALFSHVAKEAIPPVPRFILAILIGAAVAGIFGVIIGIPVLRLRGDYLAIVTLAFGEIIKNLINILYVGVDETGLHVATSSAGMQLAPGGKQILKGALGISGTSTLYKDIKDYFFLIGVILILITLFIVQNLVHSRSGRAIMSTRDNRIASESVGINVTKYKLLAFTVSAALAGVAGVLYSHNISMLKVSVFDYNMSILVVGINVTKYKLLAFTVSAALAGVAGVLYSHNISMLKVSVFDYNMSILVLVYVVLGGIGNLRGSVIAAVILYALPEPLRGFANYRMLIYAVVLIVMMLFNWAPAARDWRSRMAEKFGIGHKKKEAA